MRKPFIAVFILLWALALAGYFPILNNSLVSDDYFFVNRTMEMPFTETWQLFTLLVVLVRPLPIFVWWMQTHLFGGEGLPSHLIDVSLHAAAAFALFTLMAKNGCASRTALLSSVLFVLTPVGPDAVTWSAARMDAMALLFVLVSIILYLDFLKGGGRLAYAGSLLAGAAALLSKEEALVLVALMPVTEVLFGGGAAPAEGPHEGPAPGETGRRPTLSRGRLWLAVLRQLPFFLMFLAYFIMRWALLGGMGGYTDVAGPPRLGAFALSVWTFLSPLNNQIFSREAIFVFGIVTAALWCLSTFMVIVNWRRAGTARRRLWLLFAVFAAVSTVPVFQFFFVVGLDHGMQDSRFLYFPMLAFIAMTVMGFFEFGRPARLRRAALTFLLLLAAAFSLWGLRGNNELWEHASAVTDTVSDGTFELVPDPPKNSSIYYQGIEEGLGNYIFRNNLQELIRWRYGRGDLRVSRLEPEIESRRDAPIYFLTYDVTSDELVLTRTLPPAGELPES